MDPAASSRKSSMIVDADETQMDIHNKSPPTEGPLSAQLVLPADSTAQTQRYQGILADPEKTHVSAVKSKATYSPTSLTVGTIGQVAHGKSTLIRAITGTKTMRHKADMVRNITIKPGYAAANIYECNSSACPRPECYKSCSSEGSLENTRCVRPECEGNYELVRKISFVDCPGHEILMRTMLTGTSAMDAALLIISAEEECPQPQTREHLTAIEALGLTNVVVVQNKVDRVTADASRKHAQQVRAFLDGTVAKDATVVPVSAQFDINIDAVLDTLANIPLPVRNLISPPRMPIVRSFDINRPGVSIEDLKGGIAGGTLLQGVLRLHDEIELRPSVVSRHHTSGKTRWTPLYSRVTSLSSDSAEVSAAAPGNLLGIGTLLAPELCRGDRLVGQVLGLRGTLSPVFSTITVQFERTHSSYELVKSEKIRSGNALMAVIGSATTSATVGKVRGHMMVLVLKTQVCAEVGERLTLSTRDVRRLVGWGVVVDGVDAERGSE